MSIFFRRIFLVLFVTLGALLAACGGGGGGSPPPVPVLTSINGAATASGSAGTTFIVYGTGFGTLAAASPVAGYTLDFLDQVTGSVVASASWLAGGWSDAYIKAVVPNTLTLGATYDVSVSTPGGKSNAASFLVTQGVAFSPSTLSWAATSALPVGIQGFPTLVVPLAGGTYIYTLGGNTGLSGSLDAIKSNVAAVNFNQINITTTVSPAVSAGSLLNSAWAATTPLPAERGFSAGAVANSFNSQVPAAAGGYVYVLGGLDTAGTAQATVYYAQVNSDGTLGTWGTTTALPHELYGHGATVFNGRFYVAGGNDATGNPTAGVYSAAINADGTLGSWSALPTLPVAVAYHQLLAAGGTLYVLGGTSSSGVDPTAHTRSAGASDTVYYSVIDVANGALTAAWATTSSMIKVAEKKTAVAIGATILTSGGLFGATNANSFQSGEESYATVSADGTVTSFGGATGSKTINSVASNTFFNHAAAFFADTAGNPHVLILGGQDIGGAIMNTEVWYQQ